MYIRNEGRRCHPIPPINTHASTNDPTKQPTPKQGLLQHHYTLKADPELGRVFREHLHYQQSHSYKHAHGSSSHHHQDAKHATAPAMEGPFEKALEAAGRRYQVEDLPRLYRRWKPLDLGSGASSSS